MSAPPWSAVSAAGWFRLSAAGYRFDRHFHDCAECWAVAADEFDVGPGDLVCTPAGTEHDIVAFYGSDLALFFLEEAVPAGGGAGHKHRDPATAWHEVPVRL